MPLVARTVGGPGAGKTQSAMNRLDMVLEKVVQDPLRVGFVSFTRAARREASLRAGARFDLKGSDLEKYGWFRTLHSVCYRALKVSEGELIVGGPEDTKWLRRSLDDERVRMGRFDRDDDYLTVVADSSGAGKALSLWDAARNRQTTIFGLWEAQERVDHRLPDLTDCLGWIERYEVAKRQDGRMDFCDLLMRFAGRRWSGDHEHPFTQVEADGEVPVLPVWFHDEMNDCSALTGLVFARLIRPSTYVYIMGDHIQAIYSWAGSDGRIFRNWPAQKEETLPVSHRCASAILDRSLRVLGSQAGDRRDFRSAREDGAGHVQRTHLEDALASLDASKDTLVLARTNTYAQEAATILEDNLIPWKPTKGQNGWTAPARAAGVSALVSLKNGGEVDGDAVWRLLDLLPSVSAGVTLFQKGTKAPFKEENYREQFQPCGLALSDCWGATPAFKEMIASGKYKDLLEPAAARMAAVAEARGVEAIGQPKVQVGTIHSAKGMGADTVVLVNRLPYPTRQAILEPEGLEEEQRVWYVGCTRARDKLVIAHTDEEGFEGL